MKKYNMNKALLPAVFSVSLVLLSCASAPLSGQTVKETRNVESFNSLSLTMSGNVYLSQGDNQSVEIECDKNALEVIQTETRGNTLTIKTKNGSWRNLGDVKIYITMKDISHLGVSGSGNIVAQTPIKCGDLDIDVSGSGNVKITDLQSPAISTGITGSGDIFLSGKNEEAKLEATITGSGNFKSDDLPVAEANVTITGSGSARVNVLKQLETNITGSGSVLYKGSPQINANSTGSGKTSRM